MLCELTRVDNVVLRNKSYYILVFVDRSGIAIDFDLARHFSVPSSSTERVEQTTLAASTTPHDGWIYVGNVSRGRQILANLCLTYIPVMVSERSLPVTPFTTFLSSLPTDTVRVRCSKVTSSPSSLSF